MPSFSSFVPPTSPRKRSGSSSRTARIRQKARRKLDNALERPKALEESTSTKPYTQSKSNQKASVSSSTSKGQRNGHSLPLVDEAGSASKGKTLRQHTSKSSHSSSKTPDEQESFFFTDKTGDADNVKLQGPAWSSIPIYTRSGLGEVIGVDAHLKIDSKESQGQNIALSQRNRGRDRPNLRKKLAKKPESFLPKAHADKQFATQSDVIQLESEIPDSEEDSESGDDEETFQKSTVTIKNMELARETQSHPTNPMTWLKFAEFQQTVMKDTQGKLDEKALKNLADLQISILTKGLETLPSDPLLLTRYMELVNQTLEDEKLRDKWKSMLCLHPEVGELWMLFMSFQQSSSSNSYFTDIVGQFYGCFGELKQIIRQRPNKGHQLENILLHLFRRCLRFMKNAGYTELFFGAYQALLEYNMYPGDQRQFSAFFDAGEPRIGEPGAKGWTLSSSTAQVPNFDKTNNIYRDILSEQSSSWHEREAVLDGLARPARVLDVSAGNEDDPFRIVLASDVEPYLYAFSEPDSILWGLIQDMGISILDPYSISMKSPFTDQYLGPETVVDAFWPIQRVRDIVQWIEGLAMEPEEAISEVPKLPFRLAPFQFDDFLHIDKTCVMDYNFLLNVFDSLSSKLDDEHLIGFHLALVYHHNHDMKAVRKLAKNYLRRITPGFNIYNTFALFEHAAGNLVEANRIWSSVVQSGSVYLESHYYSILTTLASFAQSQISDGDYIASLNTLYTILYASPEVITSLKALQTLEYLDRNMQQSFSFSKASIAMQLGELKLMLAYATDGPVAVFDVLSLLLIEIKERHLTETVAFERLLMRAAHILHGHSERHRVYKASMLREVLQIAVEYFPYNTYFLHIFFVNETRMRYQRHLETVLEDFVLERPCHVSWLFGVWMSLHRMEDFTSDISSGIVITRIRQTRAIFERAVAHKDTQRSLLLWRTFIAFEQRVANDSGKAWNVFIRGTALCGWSKSYLLIGFTFGTEHQVELRLVYRTMLDRGHHVRHDLRDKEIILPDDGEEDDEDMENTGRAHLIEGI